MGRGGHRHGAGRKPKIPKVNGFGPKPVPPQTGVPTTNGVSPIEEFDAPDDLTKDERDVWLKQAPHAFKNRMLTRATALSFERYCKVVVLERNEARSSGVGGANHRGMLKLIRDYEKDFGLVPSGRAMAEADPVPQQQDDDEAFFGGPRGVVGGRA
jgi:hypothetical protein